MKKLIITMCIAIVLLSGCANQDVLNYTAFLELLEANGFSFEEIEDDPNHGSMLSLRHKFIRIGDDVITIYEYASNRAMERDSNTIDKSGFSINRRDGGTSTSWASNPYYFKKDLIIVNYVGENEQIIGFLNETLGNVFAGHGYQN